MSAVLARIAPFVSAAWRVQPGALMLLGWTPKPLPDAGIAQVPQVQASRGAFRALSWPEPEGGHAFLTAIRVPDHADPSDGGVVLLRTAAGVVTLDLPAASAKDAAFGQHAASLAGGHEAGIARFMLDTLRPPAAGGSLPGLGTMLRAFLSQAVQPDGCIEITCAVPDGCVLLQGWGARLSGSVQVVLAGVALPCFAGFAGEFARTDTAAPAGGVMLALPPAALPALTGVDHVFVLSDAGLHSRALVEHRLLGEAESIGHIRHMLPAIRCPAPMHAMLHDALRPRYEGRDTLHGHAQPVRAAVDMVAAAPGAGAYLSGWVFDPARQISALHLCGKQGFTARLDTSWTRIPRPDVSDAFRLQPGFPAPPDDAAGFAVSTLEAPAANEALFLQISFADGDRAFMPILPSDPGDPALRARLLAGIDLYKPSGLPVIERQAAPFMARVHPAPSSPARVLLSGPLKRAHAIVVPVVTPTLPRALLSQFLHDPLDGSEHLVLVCGPDWKADLLDALRDMVAFYDLPASILLADMAGPVSALREAAQATGAETFLLMAPGVAARAPGWRENLRRAAAGVAFACPTLLYEDWSIRYAGQGGLRFVDGPPYADPHTPMAGMPASLAVGMTPLPTASGTLECCAMGRAIFTTLDGPGALATAAAQEAAFFLHLQAAGMSGVWVPTVQAYAPETPDPSSQAARLLDGWVLRHTWQEKH